MSVSTAISWLKFASALLLLGFGLMFAFAAWPQAAGLSTLLIDFLFWPLDGAQFLAAPETRIILAIGGGITFGWGVMVWTIVSHVMPSQPGLARMILLRSLLAWFVVDSLCSTLAGVPLNVLANTGFLAAFLWPLLRMERVSSPIPS